MSNYAPAPSSVEADPKRPYKAYAAMVVAFIGLIWANLAGRESLNDLTAMEILSIVVPAILTFGATYLVENPKVVATHRNA